MDDRLQSDRCAKLLSAIAAPERLRILLYLGEGPHNVTEIAAMLEAPLVNASHHVGVLRQVGLIEARKKGRFVIYSLAPGLLGSAMKGESECFNLGCCQLEIPPRIDLPAPQKQKSRAAK